MRLGAFSSALLALAVSACAQSEPPVSQFETVTINLSQPASQLGGKARSVPLPVRKPAHTAAADPPPLAAPPSQVSQDAAPDSAPFLPRMPNLRQIASCEGAAGADCKRSPN
jgi:hypothetical protein